MYLRKNKDFLIQQKRPEIKINRGLTKEEYERLLNELFTYIDYFKNTYKEDEFNKGQKRAYYLMADTLKCQILNDEIDINIDIKKYVDELLNM